MGNFRFSAADSTKLLKSERKVSQMSKCPHKDRIDDYLFNRLPAAEREEFEEHYFNCAACFESMRERDEMISVIKARGAEIFAEEPAAARDRAPAWYQHVLSLLTARQWAVAAVSAAVLLIALFGVLPSLKHGTPQFYLTEGNTVRGGSIQLISPLSDVGSVPSFFEWKSLGGDLEYEFYLSSRDLIWKGSTKESRISLPDEVKRLLVAGENYSWQVKAFSSRGALVAVSEKVRFSILSSK